MPKYYEGKEEDRRPCSGLREDLKECLLHSSCVLKDGKTPKQCAKEGHCKEFLTSFFECKRSLEMEKSSVANCLEVFITFLDNAPFVGQHQKIQRKKGVLKLPIEKQGVWTILNACAPHD